MPTPRSAVLFLCVANSARSQMAEGLARHVAPPGMPVYSAGSQPARVNPYAVRAMAELGIDLGTHRSKSVHDIPTDELAVAVVLCEEEVCPTFDRDVRTLYWPHADPASAVGSDAEILQSFREVRDQLRGRIEALLAAPEFPEPAVTP